MTPTCQSTGSSLVLALFLDRPAVMKRGKWKVALQKSVRTQTRSLLIALSLDRYNNFY